MFTKSKTRIFITAIIFITVVEGIFPANLILNLPSEKESVFFWGLSLPRLLILAGIFILMLFFSVNLAILISSRKYANKIANIISGEKGIKFFLLIGWKLVLFIIWLAFFDLKLSPLKPFFIRLTPLFFYLGLISVNIIIVIIILLLSKNTSLKSKIAAFALTTTNTIFKGNIGEWGRPHLDIVIYLVLWVLATLCWFKAPLILLFVVNFLLLISSRIYGEKIINIVSGGKWIKIFLMIEWQLLLFFIWLGFLDHEFSSLQLEFIRLRPLFFYLGLISVNILLVTFILLLSKNKSLKPKIIKNSSLIKFWVLISLIFIFMWLFIAITRIGITESQPLWGEAGTPIFGYQILIGLCLAAFAFTISNAFFKRREENKTKLPIDTILCIVLWVLASSYWIKAPIFHNYSVPRGTLPNFERFPFDGAAFYESSANMMLIGEGFSTAFPSYRPVYPFFLSILHLIVGPNYIDVINLQTIILALSIPLLYLIGKKLHSRPVGLIVSILGIFIELNSIYGMPYTRVSNSKLMLTEMLTGLFILFSVFLLIDWLKKPNKNSLFGLMGIGILGIGILLRLHVFFIIFTVIGLSFFAYNYQFKKRLKFSILSIFIVFLAITPWMTRNYLVLGEFSLLSSQLDRVIEHRWGNLDKETNIPDTDILYKERTTQINGKVSVLSSLSTQYQSQGDNDPNQITVVISHFIHNEVLSLLSLPLSYKYQPISLYYENNKFDAHWDGKLTASEVIMLAINILIVALGIAKSIDQNKIAGLLPIAIHLGYNLGNSLVRTSGWRYLKPTNWVFSFYFCVGIVTLFIVLTRSIYKKSKPVEFQNKTATRKRLSKYFSFRAIFLFVFLISISISFAPLLFADRYGKLDQENLLNEVLPIVENEMGISRDEIFDMLSSPQSTLLVGRGLYPTFYDSGQKSRNKDFANELLQYQFVERIEFELVNKFRTIITMPMEESPKQFLNGSDVIVIGCVETSYISAWAIFISDNINDGNFTAYIRSPYQEPKCPLLLP